MDDLDLEFLSVVMLCIVVTWLVDAVLLLTDMISLTMAVLIALFAPALIVLVILALIGISIIIERIKENAEVVDTVPA